MPRNKQSSLSTLQAILITVLCGMTVSSLTTVSISNWLITQNIYQKSQAELHDNLQQVLQGQTKISNEISVQRTTMKIDEKNLRLLSEKNDPISQWLENADQNLTSQLLTGLQAYHKLNINGQDKRSLTTLVDSDPATHQATFLTLSIPIGSLQTIQQKLIKSQTNITFWVTAATLLLTISILKEQLRPLQNLTKALRKTQVNGKNVPIEEASGELYEVTHAYNTMIENIERLNASQERFISDAGHELRSPLTSIAGHASFLLRRSKPTEQQRESLEVIVREAERMTRLVQDLQMLMRQDIKPQHHKKVLSIATIADEVRKNLQKTHSITVNIQGDAQLLADPDSFTQIFTNLITNAAHADASTINIAIQQHKTPEHITITLEDNGHGIEASHLPKLFNRFYRAQESRERDKGGSGLGLSITEQLIREMQGTIKVTSTVGQGTTFTLDLPGS